MSSHGYLEVKNWEQFQHYKNRNPPWIKLHTTVLDNYEFSQLDDIHKAHLVGIWVLASKLGNKIPADPEFIRRRIGATRPVDLETLITAGFIARLRRSSDLPPELANPALPETEEEAESKKETETTVAAGAAAEVTHKDCLKLTIEKLYLGSRPADAVMRTEGSLARSLGSRFGYDRLARAIEGLARRRDSGELSNVGRRQIMSLKWLNSAKFDVNQLAASEDAYYRSDPEPRRGRGKVTDIGDIVASITPRAG